MDLHLLLVGTLLTIALSLLASIGLAWVFDVSPLWGVVVVALLQIAVATWICFREVG